jgi:hypothetical protein
MALRHRVWAGIGLLQIEAPVFELLERNRNAGDGAPHEGSGPVRGENALEAKRLESRGWGPRAARNLIKKLAR